jgi:hypothetical protein
MASLFHYTDKDGWNAIRSQPEWRFLVSRPKAPWRPTGAYFTDIEPNEENLRTLADKIRVPRVKLEYVFEFVGTDGILRPNPIEGRDARIYFSPVDYFVERARHRYSGAVEGWQEKK